MKDRVEIEKLYIFDMDNTILKNPQKEDCERVWLEKFGTKWPYQGVYSKPESLDFNIFNIPTIPHVIEKYNEVKDENNIHNVILTGRLIKLKNEVMNLLNYHNLYFDEYLLNNKGDTLTFKLFEIERLVKEFANVKEIFIYDDRVEHLPRFKELALKLEKERDISIYVYQVTEQGINEIY